MELTVRVRLSVMMFAEFFIWGGWFVTMGTYLTQTLQATGAQNAMAYSTQSWGAIIAPFVIGLIADRFFSAQRILGILHLAGAGLLFYVATKPSFEGFYPIILAYMILYMPTLALVNAVAFRQMKDAEKEFAGIRVWGTAGWIVAGLLIGWMAWETTGQLKNTFLLTGAVSAGLGLFSFTLPDTPPAGAGSKTTLSGMLGLEALSLLRNRNFFIFFLSCVLICIPLAFYYQETNVFLNETGMTAAAAKMSMGQMSELAFMLLMPLFFRRLGVKWMLLVAMAAWVLRYLLFGWGNTGANVWMLYAGIILHGICYDFFFVTGQIYTDKKAGKRIRSAAQGMITLATYGVGMLVGFWIAGKVTDYYTLPDGQHQWQKIWVVPAAIAAVVGLQFALLFKNEKQVEE